jgi:hypothetical protein
VEWEIVGRKSHLVPRENIFKEPGTFPDSSAADVITVLASNADPRITIFPISGRFSRTSPGISVEGMEGMNNRLSIWIL